MLTQNMCPPRKPKMQRFGGHVEKWSDRLGQEVFFPCYDPGFYLFLSFTSPQHFLLVSFGSEFQPGDISVATHNYKKIKDISRVRDTNYIMMKEGFVVLVACAFLFTTVEAQRGIGGTIRDFINRMLGRETDPEITAPEITPIEDILKNPEEYSDKTVTVEGILGGRIGYGWMRGDIYGIYDFGNVEEYSKEEYEKLMNGTYEGPANIKGISVDLRPDFEKLNKIANGSFETYKELIEKEYEHVESMLGKKVRVTGVIVTEPYMTNFEEPVPLLASFSDRIEVIE